MEFNELVKKAKLRLLRMHYESRIGHIGGNLSALDAMLFLHCNVMAKEDMFVLSKGHSAGALYTTLWAAGRLSNDDLNKFHQDGAKLAGHPVGGWTPGISFSTGSLGHGLSLSAGVAFARKLKQEKGRVFCLMSDGEWEEGSNWEALIFIAHHRLNNLVLLVDVNGLQGFGDTTAVASLEPLADKIRSFGVNVLEIDGHDPSALDSALKTDPINRPDDPGHPVPGEVTTISELPTVILLRTIKGHGISFMENRMEWHYLPLTEAQYLQAVKEVGGA